MLSVRIAGVIGVLLLIGHLFLMASSLRAAKENLQVTEKMRKLATIVIQNFPDKKNLNNETFWKAIGRAGNPMKDPWDSAFVLESRGSGEFFWKSNGADRRKGTGDDLEVKVPFVDGPPPDLGPPEGATGFPATDAK